LKSTVLSRVRIVAAIFTLDLLLCGCAQGASSGPLEFPPSGGAICGPILKANERLMFGDLIRYLGDGELTIDSVDLVNPANLRIDSSYTIAVDNAHVIGTDSWPPTGISPQVWAARHIAAGTKVAAGEQLNIVLVLGPIKPGTIATSDGMIIEYHDASGTSYRTLSHTGMGLGGDAACTTTKQ
jgi:hypothetical protein